MAFFIQYVPKPQKIWFIPNCIDIKFWNTNETHTKKEVFLTSRKVDFFNPDYTTTVSDSKF